DTGPPGETIDIPINTGEQSSLALPTGEGHESIMDMQLSHAFSEPLSSHCETGLVSRRILGLLAFCQSLPARSRAGGPAAASATPASALPSPTAQSGMVFAPSASGETEKHRQDALCCGRGEATAPASQRGIRMATPLRHTTSGTTAAPCPWR